MDPLQKKNDQNNSGNASLWEIVRKREKSYPQINLLVLTPIRAVQWEKDERGLVTLLKPKFRNPYLAKFLLPRLKKPHFKISLDDIVSFVWLNCDGNQTIEIIADKLKQSFGDSIEPLYERIGLFFQSLEKSRFIDFKEKPQNIQETNS